MTLRLAQIELTDLSRQEKESILAHAIDLHLVGSDEADSVGFDLVERRSTSVPHILRALDADESVGIVYLLPVRGEENMVEMTVLIHEPYRRKHYVGKIVELVEDFIRGAGGTPGELAASIHDHNPWRQELTGLLMRHGYTYSRAQRMFVKKIA